MPLRHQRKTQRAQTVGQSGSRVAFALIEFGKSRVEDVRNGLRQKSYPMSECLNVSRSSEVSSSLNSAWDVSVQDAASVSCVSVPRKALAIISTQFAAGAVRLSPRPAKNVSSGVGDSLFYKTLPQNARRIGIHRGRLHIGAETVSWRCIAGSLA